MQGDLGDQLLDDGLAERIEVFGHHDECPRAADNIVLIVFLQTARRVDVLGVPGHGRGVAENHQAIDGDALGDRLVASESYVPARIVCAVPRDVDCAVRTVEGRPLQLGGAISIPPLIEVRSANARGISSS